MSRLLMFVLALVVVCAVVTVVHRCGSAAAPSMTGHLSAAAAGGVAGEVNPLAARLGPLPRSHQPHPKNVCGGGETSPGVGLPSQDHGSSLVTCRLRRLDVTAYCQGGTTASGVTARYGMAASNLFPFGTRLRVPGWPVVVTVADRVGWGSDLDLYDSDCQRDLRWGRRSLLVEVLSR